MKEIQYLFSKVKWRLLHLDRDKANDFFRRGGVQLGKNCRINSNILTAESYLITLGDNVTISDHVSFITHDNSISKVIPSLGNLFGKIVIGDNCFIGAHSVLLYGVTIPPNTIIAAGSVVTKSFSLEKTIIGGNPAKVIGKWDEFADRNRDMAINIKGLSSQKKKSFLLDNVDLLIDRRV